MGALPQLATRVVWSCPGPQSDSYSSIRVLKLHPLVEAQQQSAPWPPPGSWGPGFSPVGGPAPPTAMLFPIPVAWCLAAGPSPTALGVACALVAASSVAWQPSGATPGSMEPPYSKPPIFLATAMSKDAAPQTAPTTAAWKRSAHSALSAEALPRLWLHGLPTGASEQDVLDIFSGNHQLDCVADALGAVHLVTERGGERLATIAIVEMRSREDADEAQRVLNGKWVHMRRIVASVRSDVGGNVHSAAVGDASSLESPRATQSDPYSNIRALLSPACWPDARLPQKWRQ